MEFEKLAKKIDDENLKLSDYNKKVVFILPFFFKYVERDQIKQ